MPSWKRENYMSDYTSVLSADGRRHWVYCGNLYQCSGDPRSWRRCRFGILGLSLLELVLGAAISLVDPLSLRIGSAPYVLIPYSAFFVACILCLGRTVHLQLLSQKIERMDYEKCILALPRYGQAITVLAGVTGLAQVVHMLLNRTFALNEWVAALCCAAAGGLGWCIFRLLKQFPFKNLGPAPSGAK